MINTLKLDFLKKLLIRFKKNSKENPFVAEMTEDENLLLEKCLKYSMTSKIRMWMLLNSINHVYNNKIEGDFVECGVWKGGNLILFETLNKKFNLEKKVFGYDTFEGMSNPTKYDVKYSGWSALENYQKRIESNEGYCFASLNEVRQNINSELAESNINLIKGKVEETLLLEKNLPKKISILRLDTDFYESTLFGLEILYPKLEKGGVLIIDDYGSYKGAKKAVDQYFKIKPFLIYIDQSSRMIIKD